MASEGLKFRVQNNKVTITGRGTCTDTDIVIPAEIISYPVIKIDSYAFENDTGLISVTIPMSVTEIGTSPFRGCSSLTSLIVDNANTTYRSEGNCIINKSNNQLLLGCKNSVIPSSVTSIGRYAFERCSGLTSITIPNSVTSVGSSAFYNCTDLTSFTLSSSVTTINSYTFQNCMRLTQIIIPSQITTIGDQAFYGCSGLTQVTIGSGVTSIGQSVFVGCSSLTSLIVDNANTTYRSEGNCIIKKSNNYLYVGCKTSTIPSSVVRICTSAFRGCSGLTSIVIPNTVMTIESQAFYDCSGLTQVTIDSGVTSIGSSVFQNCSGLTSITIPPSVVSIGSSAFRDCSGLTSITISNNATSIGNYVFKGCVGLTSMTIPSSVTSIGNQAFEGCVGLTSMTIPSSVTSIGSSAFQNCTSLAFVMIGSGVTSIDSSIFQNCSALTSLIVDSANTIYRSEGNCIIKKSNNSLFLGCKNSVIPSSVTGINSQAFKGCTGLTSITIPSSVTWVGSAAFSGCSSLVEITLPFVGDGTFYTLASPEELFGYIFGTASYTGAIPIDQYYDASHYSTYYIPSQLRSVTVTGQEIKHHAFYGCSMLTSITIPNITAIGGRAFYNCTATINWGNSPVIRTIGNYAFSGYKGSSIMIPDGVTSIGGRAFEECTGLTSMILPAGVVFIEDYAFDSCTALTSITIPDSMRLIRDYAFNNCTALISATIPNSVTQINTGVFYGCSGLTSIVLPEGLGSIGDSAFAGCSNVATIDYDNTQEQWNAITKGSGWDNNLGANVPGGYIILFRYNLDYSLNVGGASYTVTGIGMVTDTDLVIRSTYKGKPVIAISDEAFKNCTSLTSAFIPSSVTSIGTSAFSGCSALTTVRIPDNSGLQSIGFNAFFNNTALTFITLPNSLSNIGGDVFNGSSLTKIYYYGSQTNWNNIVKNDNWDRNTNPILEVIYQSVGLAYELQQDSTYAVTGKGTCQDTILTIPMEHLGVPVTLIKTNAFYENQDITSVTILDNLRVIGTSAFQGCHSLETAIIGNNVTTIGQSAFADNIHLYKVQLGSSLNTINDSAFINCYRLVEVVNNSTLNVDKNSANGSVGLYSKKIWTNDETYESKLSNNNNFILYKKDDNTYSLIDYVGDTQNPNLNSLNLSEINNYGLYQNVIITQLELPATVTTIQDKAFGDCDSLTEVRINEGTKIINNEAFEKCDALSMVYLPSTLISIGDYAFDEFNGIIKYNDTANKWDLVQKGNLALGPEAKIYALASATTNTRKDFIGEYRGFTFGKTNNGIYDDNCHSSYYGIVRTSSSNRYEDKLNGTLKENTQSRTNADGTIYFGTNITQRQFTVNFAFDSMSESQLLSMKKWLNPKEIKDLIFDEDNPLYSTDELNDDNYILIYGTPNNRIQKIWKAKVTGQTSVKHLCFDENHQRIYKGDGSIQFTCYYPYALGTKLESPANGTILVKSDLEVPFIWSGGFNGLPALPKGQKYSLKTSDNEVASITLNTEVSADGGGYAQRIEWNSEKGLVYLVQSMDGVEKNRIILPISGNSLFKLQPNFEYGVYDEDTSCIGRISYIPRYL